MVYLTEAVTGTPSGKTINVTTPGYYYYDQPSTAEGLWKGVNVRANNGVEVNETNQIFQLGGSLNKATTITTTAEYTLAVAGLQNTTDAAKATDAFMVVGSTGILKKADIKYSSTEQVTGKKWTDGKAVYERVLEISITGGEVNKITLAEGSRPAKILGMRMISRADNSVTTEISRYDATSGLLVFGSGRTTQYQKTGTYDLVLEYIK
ncbi:hypothetical protein OBK27_12945 [Empedobacter falsenii]